MSGISHFLEPGFQAEHCNSNRVAVIPVPYGETVSWLGGAEQGPQAILEASHSLELFDDELLQDTWQVGIETLPPIDCDGSTEEVITRLLQTTEQALNNCQLPIILGGEHSITLGGVAACLRKYPDLCVVQADAHLDLRREYTGTIFSHACIMRRIDDLSLPFFQAGIRSFSKEEWHLCLERNWRPWTMTRIHAHSDWLEQLVAEIKGRPVYLTFDLDALDPSILPATGTPEPDGFSWPMATRFIREIADNATIVGADFVELAPPVGAAYSGFTAAKLIYRTLGYIFSEEFRTA